MPPKGPRCSQRVKEQQQERRKPNLRSTANYAANNQQQQPEPDGEDEHIFRKSRVPAGKKVGEKNPSNTSLVSDAEKRAAQPQSPHSFTDLPNEILTLIADLVIIDILEGKKICGLYWPFNRFRRFEKIGDSRFAYRKVENSEYRRDPQFSGINGLPGGLITFTFGTASRTTTTGKAFGMTSRWRG